ncbi:14-3-3-like protein 2 [Octopus sinensis]|uniref:14-3-3-like protein 2 n=1 Tax=Octopus sinensis TaxID=2607531 RepID=A0A6P7TZY0_9MOLL|nr:14-3-3-like protein 2 [Octopus sinensis]
MSRGCTYRDELRIRAKLYEHADRYPEMACEMKRLFDLDPTRQFSPEERNLFSAAYKNVVGSRRFAHRVLSSLQKTEEGDEMTLSILLSMKKKEEEEITRLCDQVLVCPLCECLGHHFPIPDRHNPVRRTQSLLQQNVRRLQSLQSRDRPS